jgi:hypothetical protein
VFTVNMRCVDCTVTCAACRGMVWLGGRSSHMLETSYSRCMNRCGSFNTYNTNNTNFLFHLPFVFALMLSTICMSGAIQCFVTMK